MDYNLYLKDEAIISYINELLQDDWGIDETCFKELYDCIYTKIGDPETTESADRNKHRQQPLTACKVISQPCTLDDHADATDASDEKGQNTKLDDTRYNISQNLDHQTSLVAVADAELTVIAITDNKLSMKDMIPVVDNRKHISPPPFISNNAKDQSVDKPRNVTKSSNGPIILCPDRKNQSIDGLQNDITGLKSLSIAFSPLSKSIPGGNPKKFIPVIPSSQTTRKNNKQLHDSKKSTD
eukprot:Awhi_evm2s11456